MPKLVIYLLKEKDMRKKTIISTTLKVYIQILINNI